MYRSVEATGLLSSWSKPSECLGCPSYPLAGQHYGRFSLPPTRVALVRVEKTVSRLSLRGYRKVHYPVVVYSRHASFILLPDDLANDMVVRGCHQRFFHFPKKRIYRAAITITLPFLLQSCCLRKPSLN